MLKAWVQLSRTHRELFEVVTLPILFWYPKTFQKKQNCLHPPPPPPTPTSSSTRNMIKIHLAHLKFNSLHVFQNCLLCDKHIGGFWFLYFFFSCLLLSDVHGGKIKGRGGGTESWYTSGKIKGRGGGTESWYTGGKIKGRGGEQSPDTLVGK